MYISVMLVASALRFEAGHMNHQREFSLQLFVLGVFMLLFNHMLVVP